MSLELYPHLYLLLPLGPRQLFPLSLSLCLSPCLQYLQYFLSTDFCIFSFRCRESWNLTLYPNMLFSWVYMIINLFLSIKPEFTNVERNECPPNGKNKGYLFWAHYIAREATAITGVLTDSKADRGMGKLFSGKKRRLGICPDGEVCSHEKEVGRQTSREAFYGTD